MADGHNKEVNVDMTPDESYHDPSIPWMGAFERVMGDQADQYPAAKPRPKSKSSYRNSAALNDTIDVIPHPSRSAAASPFKIPDQNAHRARSGSLDTNSPNRPIFTRSSGSQAAQTTRMTNTGSRLVSVSQEAIFLPDIYLNHAPSLQPLRIKNLLGERRILLRLSSNLGRALVFMKRKRSGHDPKQVIFYPTNTAKWANADGLHPTKLRDIRHLFANLEASDSLILEPGADEEIFICFRPSEFEQFHLDDAVSSPSLEIEKQFTIGQEDASSRAPQHSRSAPTSDSMHIFHSVDVSGSISLRASTLFTAGAVEEGSGPELPSSSASNMSSNSSSRPPSIYGSNASSSLATASAATAESLDGPSQSQELELPFSSTYCRPQLAASKSMQRHKLHQAGAITLDFGDIFVGQSLEMEVLLHNQSQIDLFWQARLDDADSMLHSPPVTLLDEKGDTLESVTSADDNHPYRPNLLGPGSTKSVKVAVHPSEPCRDYEQVVTITNMHNAGNSIRILVRANMLGEARDDALSILSGDVVDFGDCTGGKWTKQLLILRNNCEQYLDVHFNVEKGIQANFQLAELAQRSNADHLAQYEPPLLPGSSISPYLAGSSESDESEMAQGGSSGISQTSPLSSYKEFPPEQIPLALELTKTPIAKAQAPAPTEEPPFLVLPCSHKSRGQDGEDDDADTSSITSQAGSRNASPERPVLQLSKKNSIDFSPTSDLERHKGNFESGKSSSSRPLSEVVSPISFSNALKTPIGGGDTDHYTEEAGSVRSEVTAISFDSRLGPSLASSSQHGGNSSNTSSQIDSRGRQSRIAGAVAMSGLRNLEQTNGNQLEELILRPGAEYRVIVSHRPHKGEIDETFSEGKLVTKTFQLLLDYARSKSPGVRSRGGRERKTVLCRIRTCTSFISVSPKLIDFGLANVGAKKSATIAVTNHSELTTRVEMRFVSKVLSMYRDEVSIPPLQTMELRLDFFPRRINDSYRKQVTVANLLNRSNDEIFEVKSKNIDEQKISFHSLFYRILTSTGSNYIDFGDVNINCTRIRSFTIENISKNKLTLELSAAHSEDLKLYIKADSTLSKKTKQGETRYAELEAADNDSAVVHNDETSKTSRGFRATGLDLKERFLESMSQDSPASIRKENTSWRMAQKDSHYRKGTKNKSSQKKNGEANEKKETTKKAPINLMSALKKGAKGRLTIKYGKMIAYKDAKLLSEFEYLDLAIGPPIDGKRIPAKSRKYQMLESLETGKPLQGKGIKGEAKGQVTPIDAKDIAIDETKKAPIMHTPALTGKQKVESTLYDAGDVSQLSLNELLLAVESQSSSLSTFFLGNPLAEEQSVRTEINLQRELQNAISSGRLVPVEMLSIGPHNDHQVIAVYTPNGSTRPHIQGNARKQDSRIFMRLVEFKKDGVEHFEEFEQMLQLENDELPVRELMVKSNICRSILELSQPHINFGQMNKGEVKTRKILIQNRSEWALRFCIRKSGNISSGDIKLKSTDRYGVVPGHGKREVEFVFCPTLTGSFQERLTVENVADRDKDETVYLKANVRKVSNFKVEPSLVEFDESDALRMGRISIKEQSFMISNVSTKTRIFVIGISGEQLQLKTFTVDVLVSISSESATKAILSKAEEEEVEHISQKLKIANRKGQADKIKKYQDRLSELGVADDASGAVIGSEDDDGVEEVSAPRSQKDDTAEKEKIKEQSIVTTTASVSQEDDASKLKQVSSLVTLTLAASQSKKLLVRLRPIANENTHHTARDSGEFSITIRIHEAKNTDDVQTVEIRGAAQEFVQDDYQVEKVPHWQKWIVFSATSLSSKDKQQSSSNGNDSGKDMAQS